MPMPPNVDAKVSIVLLPSPSTEGIIGYGRELARLVFPQQRLAFSLFHLSGTANRATPHPVCIIMHVNYSSTVISLHCLVLVICLSIVNVFGGEKIRWSNWSARYIATYGRRCMHGAIYNPCS